jgi:Tol biopolymer transport system component
VAIAATAMIQPMMRPRADTMSRHFEIPAPEPFNLNFDSAECMISPDGRMMAMVLGDSAGTFSLWIRSLDSFKPRMLPGTRGATLPFWSPDSRSLGFFAGGKLKKIAIEGGDPEVLADVRTARGGTWNRDDLILFAPTSNGPLYTIPAGGGDPQAVTRLDSTRNETAHRFPRFLPDGRRYLFSVLGGNAGRVTTVAGALGDTSRRAILTTDVGATYSPSGHLLFLRKGVLSSQRFDVGSLRLSGEPVSLGDTPQESNVKGAPVVSVAHDGTLAYMFVPLPTNRIAWFDRAGREVEQVPLAPGSYVGLDLSPDGRSALVNHAISTTETELLVVDLERGTSNRLATQVESFVWSPDGKRVAFADGSAGPQAIAVVLADGSMPAETMLPSGADFRRLDGWTPDGRALLIDRLDPQTQWDPWVLPLEGDRVPRPYLRRPANENQAAVSPDGRWLCYNSDETGRVEGYVQSFPTPGPRYQVTTDGTGILGWKADGKVLGLGPTPDRVTRVVDVLPGDGFRVGPPRPGIRLPELIFGADIDREWTRLLVIVPAGKQPKPTIRIVLDWTALLARR